MCQNGTQFILIFLVEQFILNYFKEKTKTAITRVQKSSDSPRRLG